jgi:hypothetical protein
MNVGSTLLQRLGVPMAVGVMLTVVMPSLVHADRCVLPSQHVGMTFPMEQVEAGWTCRLRPIITHYTTANKIGPLRTPLAEALYVYLLDHPTLVATLINRLDLGLYRAESRGPHRYWGQDGEGTEGLVELVYEDRATRMYYLDGSHDSRLLSHLTGKAVLLLWMNPVKAANGMEAVETTMVSYTRLDNRVLSGIAALLRPLVGGTVTRKLVKGVETVNRLSEVMQQQPDRVLFEATDPPGLPEEQVAFLKEALATWRDTMSNHSKNPGP